MFLTEWRPTEKVMVIARNGFLLFAGITFLIAVFNTIRKFLSPKAKRKRTVNESVCPVHEILALGEQESRTD